ncbi:MAG: FAD binding domain-containing protein [Alphaproteobacteria bacterium]|nr:FAD binding domain-containing protein [Alphaproteobacteria bacterium]
MKPAAFEYHAPATVDDAVALLAEVAPDGGRVLAGGQSLVPTMAFRLAQPPHLVDINGIAGLDRIEEAGGRLVIGALARHAAFHAPVAEGPLGPLMAEMARHIGHAPIRARGTFTGSLAQADPASEWVLLAVTLGASVTAQSIRGSREIAAADLIQGAMTTALTEDELLTEACVPLPAEGTHFGFAEFNRRAGDFALAMALAAYRIEDGKITDARIGIGGAEDRPRRIGQAEAALDGAAPGAPAFEAAARAVAEALDPMEDHATDAAYRRELAAALTIRALKRAQP